MLKRMQVSQSHSSWWNSISRMQALPSMYLTSFLATDLEFFSVEPNYYCDNGCCAKDLLEFAFIKVSPIGQVCSPRSRAATLREALPHGCRGFGV